MAALTMSTSILPSDTQEAEPLAAQQEATAQTSTAPPIPMAVAAAAAAATTSGGASSSGIKRTADGAPEVTAPQKPRVSIREMMKYMDAMHPLDQPEEERPSQRRREDDGDAVMMFDMEHVVAAIEEMQPNEETDTPAPPDAMAETFSEDDHLSAKQEDIDT